MNLPCGAGVGALRDALRRVVAPECVVCRVERGDPVCRGCLQDFFGSDRSRCPVCALPLPWQEVAACGRCLSRRPAFDRTVALADYAPPVDGMVMALKHGARLDLAGTFGVLLARRVPADETMQCLMAVPLAPSRQRERGFNQALEIARVVSRRCALPLRHHALVRVRPGPPQQSLPLSERRRQVRGAFAVQAPPRVHCVAVIDDVMTSGATLDEIARVLKQAGVSRVVNLVVARTA